MADRYSFEYYFPARIWIMVFMNSRCYGALQVLLGTIAGGARVFVLYGCFVIIGAITGLTLFREILHVGDLENNFKDFTNRTTASNPNYSDGLIRLADCYYVSRQYSEALTAYNKAKAANSANADYVLLQAGVISGIMKK